MPWKNTTAMDQKVEFINEWLSNQYTVTELCRAFGISRPTGYKMIYQYGESGYEGLRERSRAPAYHPNRTKQEIEQAILKHREDHPRWGAKKIEILLLREHTKEDIPSLVTIHNVLKRNGLIKPRKRIKRVKPVYPIFDPEECNEVWSADYKGRFLMGNKIYCHPLTIADSKSRYLFTAKGHYKENFKSVKSEFIKVFKEYGLPEQIHTDNGTPFGNVAAIKRFTKLSYWFIDLGIMPVFSDPSHPEQNGRHERMHRDLKGECALPPSYNMITQQRKFNAFVKEYNHVRPHEALDMETPAKVHKVSDRKYPNKIEPYEYPVEMKKQYVTKNAAIRWKTYYWIYMSRALAGKYVGMLDLGNGIWKVYYRDVFLGYLNEKIIKEKNKSVRLTNNIV